MKSRSLGYLTKEGFRNLRVNKLMSFASITVLFSCLLLIGIAFMLLVNIGELIDDIEAQNVIMVYLEDTCSPTDIPVVQQNIEAIENVDTCTFVPKDEAYQQVLSELENVREYLDGVKNPLPDAFRVTVKDMLIFDGTVERIAVVDKVMNVRENSELAGQLAGARDSVTYISAGVIILLLIVSLFIISNTIKVTMFSRRLEISIMKSVGATNGFIRWPFMIEGMLLGLIAGLLAVLCTWGVYELALRSFESVFSSFSSSGGVPFEKYAHMLLISFVGVGIFTGVFGSASSIRKYLKERKFVEIENDV